MKSTRVKCRERDKRSPGRGNVTCIPIAPCRATRATLVPGLIGRHPPAGSRDRSRSRRMRPPFDTKASALVAELAATTDATYSHATSVSAPLPPPFMPIALPSNASYATRPYPLRPSSFEDVRARLFGTSVTVCLCTSTFVIGMLLSLAHRQWRLRHSGRVGNLPFSCMAIAKSGGGAASPGRAAHQDPPRPWRAIIDLSGCAACLIGSLLLHGMCHERIMTRRYEDAETASGHFSQPAVLSLGVCMVALALSLTANVLLHVIARVRQLPPPPWEGLSHEQCSVGAYLHCLASVSSSAALQFVTFPLVMVFAACESPFFVLATTACCRRLHREVVYLTACVILLGAGLALWGELDAPRDAGALELQGSATARVAGALLLILCAASNALTPTKHALSIARHEPTLARGSAVIPMLLGLNLWSALYLLPSCLLSGELRGALDFAHRNPAFALDLVQLSVAAAFAQLWSFITLCRFGHRTFAAITAARLVASAILSIVVYRHRIVRLQALGMVLAFSALTLSVMAGPGHAPSDETAHRGVSQCAEQQATTEPASPGKAIDGDAIWQRRTQATRMRSPSRSHAAVRAVHLLTARLWLHLQQSHTQATRMRSPSRSHAAVRAVHLLTARLWLHLQQSFRGSSS